MTREDTQARIDALVDDAAWRGGWYQPIVFPNGARSVSTRFTPEEFFSRDSLGLNKWNKIIRPHIGELAGKRFLEIGCNAGLYVAQAALEGAAASYGLENHPHFLKQADLVMEEFSYHVNGERVRMVVDDHEAAGWCSMEVHIRELAGTPWDVALLSNALYWIGYSDEAGFVDHYEEHLNQFLRDLARIARRVVVIGSEGNSRSRWVGDNPRLHHVGAALDDVVPRLSKFFRVVKAEKISCDRRLNLAVGVSPYF